MQQFPINKYGEVEVEQNELRYFIPIAYIEASELDELEEAYRRKGKELMDSPYYLFANNLEVVRNRFCFTFQLEEMKAFHYIRQFPFEEQLYYLRSLVELAKNIEQTPILWDKNSLLVDLTDGKIKTFLFGFDKHPIHVSQDVVDGLKETIILALTTLHRVLGKPRRIDFIDQREIVIRFAENILHGKSVSEIGRVVEDTILEIERQLEQEKKEQQKSNVLTAFKEKWNAKKETAATVEQPVWRFSKKKSNLPAPYEKKKSFWDNKYVYLSASALALIILIGNSTGAFDFSKPEEAKAKQEQTEVIPSNKLIGIYRQAITGDKQKALDQLERLGFDNLSKKDQKVMLSLYEETGQPEKAIKLKPEYAEKVVNDLVSNQKYDDLRTLQSKVDNPVVNYEVAYLDKKWEDVVRLKDKVKMTDRRKSQLLSAYLHLERVDEAKNLAAESPELLQKIQDFEMKKKQVEDLKMQVQQVQKNEKDAKKRDEQVKKLNEQIKQLEAAINNI
ncbi:Hypothetical protein GTNG_3453 (plasmid) [Geobacillus thermodenitrificans NG80-2]|uniref:Uncharacterized protein n=1 Tax=Geobacillus thermodenitrificans (strain NG80-2) TaxID=420246 RepID=A4ITY2_GEOTN|nr:Hypothetical protein GTNG_3453 [Geobacillus thermodenitrificans NG80-2]